MTVSKAKGMPKGCCGKSFLFQWVGYEYFRLSNPTAIFPLYPAVLSSKTEKIFTSEERKGGNNEKHFAVYFDRSCCGADAVRLLLQPLLQPLLLPLSGRIPISKVNLPPEKLLDSTGGAVYEPFIAVLLLTGFLLPLLPRHPGR